MYQSFLEKDTHACVFKNPDMYLVSSIAGMSSEAWSLSVPAELGLLSAVALGNDRNWACAGTSKGFVALWDTRYRVLAKLWRHSSRSTIHRLATCARLPLSSAESPPAPLAFVAAGENYSVHSIYPIWPTMESLVKKSRLSKARVSRARAFDSRPRTTPVHAQNSTRILNQYTVSLWGQARTRSRSGTCRRAARVASVFARCRPPQRPTTI